MSDLQKVLSALEMNRVMGVDKYGKYTKEITPPRILEAIEIVKRMILTEDCTI